MNNLPSMDSEGLNCFKEAISKSSVYLEYGCGGSTIYASEQENIKSIISVDTDKAWIEKVKENTFSSSAEILLNHCNLGEVGSWGWPINNDKIASFWEYSTLPWTVSKAQNLKPDTILVDGRFRVSSFLYSLLTSSLGTVILFDDYYDRPNYFLVEAFTQPPIRHGRMAMFINSKEYEADELVKKIMQHCVLGD